MRADGQVVAGGTRESHSRRRGTSESARRRRRAARNRRLANNANAENRVTELCKGIRQITTTHKEVDDEGDSGDGPGCGNGRNEAGGAARAAGSYKRRRRSDSCVGIRPD